MADDYTANAGAGGATFASDEIGGRHFARVKTVWGVDGAQVDTSASAPMPVQVIGQATSGATTHRLMSAATTNATSVKASAGTVYGVFAINLSSTIRYLKLYNKASAPTVGVDTPMLTLPVPGDTTGAGFTLSVPQGIAFSTGIALALTTGYTDADAVAVGAGELFIHTFYV